MKKSFTDNENRVWIVDVNVASIRRVKLLTDVNLFEMSDGDKLVNQLIADPGMLCDVIYALCKPEADRLGVTDEQFGAAMAGDVIEQATVALLDAIVDFTPN